MKSMEIEFPWLFFGLLGVASVAHRVYDAVALAQAQMVA